MKRRNVWRWCVAPVICGFTALYPSELLAQAPTITKPPQSLNVAPGMKAVFSVQASGSALRYQWQFNGADILKATNASFTLTNVAPTDAGDYQVIVTVVREPLRFETTPDALSFTNGTAHLRLAGLAGAGAVTIFASTNLTDWESVLSHAPVAGSLDFDDTGATNTARFYRAVEGP